MAALVGLTGPSKTRAGAVTVVPEGTKWLLSCMALPCFRNSSLWWRQPKKPPKHLPLREETLPQCDLASQAKIAGILIQSATLNVLNLRKRFPSRRGGL